MALSASQRASLPDSAFAYIDGRGRRMLPIHDAAHVRNALARFGQVRFEDDASRDRARKRLLNAARKFGIVPVGFIEGEVRSARQARSAAAGRLPSGSVTFLLTDIERSTVLLARLGDGYARLLRDVRGMIRQSVREFGGYEVDSHADGYFGAFRKALPAIQSAVALQRALAARAWPEDLECKVRMGIHTGRPTLTETGYIGLSVHAAARICSAAHGGQIVVSSAARTAAGALPRGVRLRSLGRHRLAGLPRTEWLYQVESEGLATGFPPPRVLAASAASDGER
jgi:class 3 adenylate cyclase